MLKHTTEAEGRILRIDWQLWSQSCQLSIKLSEHRNLLPRPPWRLAGRPRAEHMKALAPRSMTRGTQQLMPKPL
ncbi:hypothetical protein EYF80_015329 [Liparis tanakae]|uniref:Uncharacterized protein n=1 Tax=Liparis tanakae TaxID=230148 RepID=A0A4Z2I8Z6_9TELE|nr:hypothetical protein EYF80_015329 [Liparis tanakae]